MQAYSLGLYEKAIPDGFSFREMLQITKRCGFNRLEMSIDESDARLARLDWTKSEINDLKQAMIETGVPIKTLCLSGQRRFPLGSHSEATRTRSMDILKKAVELSAEIGNVLIMVAGYDVYYEEGDAETLAYFEQNLALAAEYAAKYGVILAFETMETAFMDTVRKAMVYVNKINSPWLGVYPDIGNLKNAAVLYGSDLLEDIRSGNGHTYAAHLKETVPGVFRNREFGSGHTEYHDCIQLLWQMGVRMFTGEFWYDGKSDAEHVISASAQFLRNHIEQSIPN